MNLNAKPNTPISKHLSQFPAPPCTTYRLPQPSTASVTFAQPPPQSINTLHNRRKVRLFVQVYNHHHLHLVTINPHSTHNHGCHISANPLTTVVKLSQMDPKHSTLGVHANPPSTTGTTPLTHLTRRPQSTRVVHHLTRTTT
jgi:hypothetical protein